MPFDPLLEREREAKRQTPLDISIKAVGVAAFVVGVFLHGCVAMSLLDGGDESSAQVEPTATAAAQTTPTPQPAVQPTPTTLPDRDNCDEIRGTQYRSVTEREFFLANCTTGMLPPGFNPSGGPPSRPG